MPAEEINLIKHTLKSEYFALLDDECTDGPFHKSVELMIKKREIRLIVDINKIRQNHIYQKRAEGLIENPKIEIDAFQIALKEFITSLDPKYGRSKLEFYIGLSGSFGSKHIKPRSLLCRFLNKTVCLDGMISSKSSIECEPVLKTYYCGAKKKFIQSRCHPISLLSEFQPWHSTKVCDEDGNPLTLEDGLSLYTNHLRFTLQDTIESRSSMNPGIAHILAPFDLIEQCHIGSRVSIVGTYVVLPVGRTFLVPHVFDTCVIANNIVPQSIRPELNITREDISACKRQSQDDDIFEKLARSIAPSIIGQEFVKRGILCLLLGGVDRTTTRGLHIRGRINILLIGDPSLGKSQLLRAIQHIDPIVVSTSGRGSSGVGLTAAVVTDRDTKKPRLDPGATVLADRGVVCIDEFDKMSDIDRTAIHEVMEQGLVTICKAGIHTRLNARCSVLAAANPIDGVYCFDKPLTANINLHSPLMSRFDLIFVMLDKKDPVLDTMTAEHVLGCHTFRHASECDGEPSVIDDANHYTTHPRDPCENTQTTSVFHNGKEYYTTDFMRKYLHIAKKVKPLLTEDTIDMISQHYFRLRNSEDDPAVVDVTTRALETLIRLSTAYAKARLSNKVNRVDVSKAINLLDHCMRPKFLSESETIGVSQERNSRENTDMYEAAEGNHEGGSFAGLTSDAKENLETKFDEFTKVVYSVCRKKNGALALDLDDVFREAREEMELNRIEVDYLITCMESKKLCTRMDPFLSLGD